MATKGIYKRGNVWWIRFMGPEGKVRQETARSHRKRDAEALLAKRKNEVQEGRYTIAKSIRRYSFNGGTWTLVRIKGMVRTVDFGFC